MIANEAYRQLKQMIYSLDTVSLEICPHNEPLILSPAGSHRIGFVGLLSPHIAFAADGGSCGNRDSCLGLRISCI